MKKLLLLGLLSGCTLTISQTDTHGLATDVGDDNPSNQVTASPNVDIPLTPKLPLTK